MVSENRQLDDSFCRSGGYRTPRWPINAKQDKNFWGKNLVGGFRTPRWPITAKQDKNFWGKKFSWWFSDTTMAYYRQSRQKYFVKFFYKIFFFFIIFFFVIFFFMKFFSRYFFAKNFCLSLFFYILLFILLAVFGHHSGE